MFEGRSVGALQFTVSLLGIWASWHIRPWSAKWMRSYSYLAAIWAFFDSCYLLMLIVSGSERLRIAFSHFVASNTFPNLFTPLKELFASLSTDATFLIFFIVSSGVVFSVLSAYWASVLYHECLEIRFAARVYATSPPFASEREPLLRGNSTRPTPSESRWTAINAPQSRPSSPFSGRGNRLGDS